MLKKSILITGGTSGLGKELVTIFLNNGFNVVATGRQPLEMPGFENAFRLFRTDFSDLKQTSVTIKEIAGKFSFDIIINNAGILSPPDLTMTRDGNEYTFQVNYLAHLLVNELIITNKQNDRPLKICSVTSPVYRLAKTEKAHKISLEGYKPLKAYSYSKLFLALMCRELPLRHPDKDLFCVSFNPGVFNSGIYRMQSTFFGFLYRVAAPFMRSPSIVARVLFSILNDSKLPEGVVCSVRKKIKKLPETGDPAYTSFMKDCYNKIGPYL